MKRVKMIVFEEEFADGDKKITAVRADLFSENEIYDFFWGGYVPEAAQRLGVSERAKPKDVIYLVETDQPEVRLIRAWDEDGLCWTVSTFADDHVWERDPEHDRSQITK